MRFQNCCKHLYFPVNMKEWSYFLSGLSVLVLPSGGALWLHPTDIDSSEEPLVAHLHFLTPAGLKELIWLTFSCTSFSLPSPHRPSVPWQYETFLVSECIDRQTLSTWRVNASSTALLFGFLYFSLTGLIHLTDWSNVTHRRGLRCRWFMWKNNFWRLFEFFLAILSSFLQAFIHVLLLLTFADFLFSNFFSLCLIIFKTNQLVVFGLFSQLTFL